MPDLRERLLGALGNLDRIVGAGAGKDDGELVAADPAGHVGGADRRPQRVGERAERLVAGAVAADVVDALEPVEVDDRGA